MAKTATDPKLERLSEIDLLISKLDAERLLLVAELKRDGASWDEIGKALGTTRQSAWETYRRKYLDLLDAAALRVDASEEELLESAAAALSRVRAERRQR